MNAIVAIFMSKRPVQCRTDSSWRVGRHVVPVVAPILLAASGVGHVTWPVFLPPPATYSPAEVSAVQRAWEAPTLHRAVEGPPAPMPLASYLALVDAPDLTAAAARHLGIAQYDVRKIGPDWYEAADDDGAHGVYRVLVREGNRRVTLSWGSRHGALLGTISGSALTVMQFEARGNQTRQRLDTYVVIDNVVAAGLARVLVGAFGHVADRKLVHGFAVTAKVAAWASERPEEFCAWADTQPSDGEQRERLLATLPACADRDGQPARSVAR